MGNALVRECIKPQKPSEFLPVWSLCYTVNEDDDKSHKYIYKYGFSIRFFEVSKGETLAAN